MVSPPMFFSIKHSGSDLVSGFPVSGFSPEKSGNFSGLKLKKNQSARKFREDFL
jgi:hypothetical protein